MNKYFNKDSLGKAVCFVFICALLLVITPIITAAEVSDNEVNVTIEQTQLGNVFFDNQPARFTIQTGAESFSWQVSDLWGTIVKQGTKDSDSGSTDLLIPLQDKGYYHLTVKPIVNGQTLGSGSENTFAVISDHDYSDSDDIRFAMNTHFGQFHEPPIWNSETKQYDSHGDTHQGTDYLPLVVAAGVNQVRDELPWHIVEPEEGLYSFPNPHLDYMSDVNELGLKSLSIMNYGNKVYDVDNQGIGAAPYTDRGREGYANYGKALFDQFSDQLLDVEVWNEYNSRAPWNRGPCRSDYNCYYEMLKEVYTTVKTAHPDARVTGPAAVTLPWGWLENLFSLGALDYLDAVTVHPYTTNAASPEKAAFEMNLKRLQGMIKQYNNGESKPIYLTEIGWMSDVSKGVTEREQAQYLVRAHVMAFAAGVEKVFWHDFQNAKLDGLQGIIRHPDDPKGRYAPKPSYVSYSNMTRQLTDKPFSGKDKMPRGIRSYIFGEGESATRVMWSPQGMNNMTIKTDGPLEVIDMMGRSETYQPYNGEVFLTVSEDAIYVKGPVQEIVSGSPLTIQNDIAETGEDIQLTVQYENVSSSSVSVKWDVDGIQNPVTMNVKSGETAEEGIVLPAVDQKGIRTILADVRIAGKLAGHIRQKIEVIEPLKLLDGKATAILAADPEFYGLTAKPGDGPASGLQIVTKAGKEAWSTQKENRILYFYFDVDDRFIYDLDRGSGSVKITVEYFDEGEGKFALAYDTHDNNRKHAPAVTLTDTLEWKQHTFELEDAQFANQFGVYDFRFGIWVPGFGVSENIAISKVEVEK